MKHISQSLYPVAIDIFRRYLQNKHGMPFNKIQVKNIADKDLERWKNIENLRNIKIGFSFSDSVERNVVE